MDRWQLGGRDESDNALVIYAAEGNPPEEICRVSPRAFYAQGDPQACAARLIAAAPDLFALLERAADLLQNYRDELDGDLNDSLAQEIRAALKLVRKG